MDLSSLNFLCYFLPVFLSVYYLCPFKLKNFILLAGSLYFCAYHSLRDLGLLLGAILVNFCLVRLMEQDGRSASRRRNFLLLALSCNIGFLCFSNTWLLPCPSGSVSTPSP